MLHQKIAIVTIVNFGWVFFMSAKTVIVELDQDVFEALQRMAKPLVDTPSSVIKRLIEQTLRSSQDALRSESSTREKEGALFRNATIPFGNLRAMYKPRNGNKVFRFDAQVTSKGIEFDGKIFDNPSSAGIHAKKLAGIKGSASSTNGWAFWEYYDSEANSWVLIDKFRHLKN